MIDAWRIVRRKYRAQAFSGDGARMNAGRWNPAGLAVVYTAQSESLAILELLAHQITLPVMSDFELFRVSFAEKLLHRYLLKELPADWRASPYPDSTQNIGFTWIKDAQSAVLQVPSAVVSREFNYLVNPMHPDFKYIEISVPMHLDLDPRLMAGAAANP